MKFSLPGAMALVLFSGFGGVHAASAAKPADAKSTDAKPADAKPLAPPSEALKIAPLYNQSLFKRLEGIAGKPLTEEQKKRVAEAEAAYVKALDAAEKERTEARARALGMTPAEMREAELKALEKMWPGASNTPVKKPAVPRKAAPAAQPGPAAQ